MQYKRESGAALHPLGAALRALMVALTMASTLAAQQSTAAQPMAVPPPQQPGVVVDPSAPPLQPGGQPQQKLPEAPPPAASAPPAQPSPQAAPQVAPPADRPLGAAAAGTVKTSGGGASRPAGNALAPVKQKQSHSLLIKLGAVAAAGIAAGTIYGLSRATPSVPPHSAPGSVEGR